MYHFTHHQTQQRVREMQTPIDYIDSERLRDIIPLERTTIWRMEQREADPFPRRRHLNGPRSKCMWPLADVLEWRERQDPGPHATKPTALSDLSNGGEAARCGDVP